MANTLRNRLIRLAHNKPELRSHLLPLIKEAGCEKLPEALRENCEKKVEEGKDNDKKAGGKVETFKFKEHADVPATIKGKKEMDFFKKGEAIRGEVVSETSTTYTVKSGQNVYEIPKKSVK